MGGGQQKFNYRLLTLIFMLGIYVQFCGQRFRETSEVSGTETSSIEEETCEGGPSYRVFVLSLIFRLEIYVQL